jgi:hypothetical protein
LNICIHQQQRTYLTTLPRDVEDDELVVLLPLLVVLVLLLLLLLLLELLVVVVANNISHDGNAEIPIRNIAAIMSFFILICIMLLVI